MVFLRCIEYYRGILFLKTDMVSHSDVGFLSRIDVAVLYDNPEENDQEDLAPTF